jgi:hypothetical protein
MLLKNILTEQKGFVKLLLATLAAALGISLLVLAAQVYLDFRKILGGGKQAAAKNFVSINKPVSLLNTLVASGFRKEEMEEIKAQPFVEDVATFTNADFKVSASSEKLHFYTEMFLALRGRKARMFRLFCRAIIWRCTILVLPHRKACRNLAKKPLATFPSI